MAHDSLHAVHAITAQHRPDVEVLVFGHASPSSGQTLLAERRVSPEELAEGRFARELDAHAAESGWLVTRVSWRTRADRAEYRDLLTRAAGLGLARATGPTRALLERFLGGEVSETLLFALGCAVRAVRAGGEHPVAEYALKAAERDLYRVHWLARLGPLGIDALLHEAESFAHRALDWTPA